MNLRCSRVFYCLVSIKDYSGFRWTMLDVYLDGCAQLAAAARIFTSVLKTISGQRQQLFKSCQCMTFHITFSAKRRGNVGGRQVAVLNIL